VSSGGYKFYVSFVDDFSRFTWIYLLKHKSDVEQIFYNFQTHVERLLNSKIRAVQSDWGGEYHRLHKYFQRTGISHRVSCPHTSQQNGIAERKHRHLVETGLALLAHSSLPIRYWDEAFLTACYLINRMPTPVLQKETPLFRLLHIHPDYSFLRIFRCACWPSLRKYNSRKLDFRSKMCVFLGYSPFHKGYKCLDRSTGRIYISRDVVFDERVFPYMSNTSPDLSPLQNPVEFPVSEPVVQNAPMRKYDLSLLPGILPVAGELSTLNNSGRPMDVHGLVPCAGLSPAPHVPHTAPDTSPPESPSMHSAPSGSTEPALVPGPSAVALDETSASTTAPAAAPGPRSSRGRLLQPRTYTDGTIYSI
jgi:histone deacetylase 1/2